MPLTAADIANNKFLRPLSSEESERAFAEISEGLAETKQILESVKKLQGPDDYFARFRLCYDVAHTLLVLALKSEGYVVDTGREGGHRIGLISLHPKLAPPSKPEYTDHMIAAHFARNKMSYGGSPAYAAAMRPIKELAADIEPVARDIFNEVTPGLRKWISTETARRSAELDKKPKPIKP